jgi:predicted PurR-regulated permease PerM
MVLSANSLIKKLLILFLIFGGLYYAKEFLIPATISGVIATLFLPFCRWMENQKIPKGIAVLVCIISFLFLLYLLGALIGWQVSAIVGDFELLKKEVVNKSILVQQYIFNNLGIPIKKQAEIIKTEQPSIASIMQVILGSLKSTFINFVLILGYMYMLLYYRNHLKQFFLKLAPANQQTELLVVINNSTQVTQKYMVGLAKMIACLWFLYGIGFGVLGVHNFIFFAILCGILEIIPYIGNITGVTITLLISAMHGSSIPVLLGVAAVYGFVQFFQGWVLEPLILGPQVKINPLFTILSLVLGQILWGIAGIALAIPIAAMCKIMFMHIEQLKPYGFLLGEIVSERQYK